MEEMTGTYNPKEGFKQFETTQAELTKNGVTALANRPNAMGQQYGQSGLSATALKAWFDKLAKILSERLNGLLKYFADGEALKHIQVMLEEAGISTMDQLIASFGDGTFASMVMKCYPDGTEKELQSLQSVINGIAKDISSEIERAQRVERALNEDIKNETKRAQREENALDKKAQDALNGSIESYTVYYAVSNNGIDMPPQSAWKTEMPSLTDSVTQDGDEVTEVKNWQFVWTKTVVRQVGGNETTYYTVGCPGPRGEQGGDIEVLTRAEYEALPVKRPDVIYAFSDDDTLDTIEQYMEKLESDMGILSVYMGKLDDTIDQVKKDYQDELEKAKKEFAGSNETQINDLVAEKRAELDQLITDTKALLDRLVAQAKEDMDAISQDTITKADAAVEYAENNFVHNGDSRSYDDERILCGASNIGIAWFTGVWPAILTTVDEIKEAIKNTAIGTVSGGSSDRVTKMIGTFRLIYQPGTTFAWSNIVYFTDSGEVKKVYWDDYEGAGSISLIDAELVFSYKSTVSKYCQLEVLNPSSAIISGNFPNSIYPENVIKLTINLNCDESNKRAFSENFDSEKSVISIEACTSGGSYRGSRLYLIGC